MSQSRLADPAENPQGEWLHQATHDYSPLTGGVASCRTCSWGDSFQSAYGAAKAAEKHREHYGRAELGLIELPKPDPHKPGRKPTATHGSVAAYNRGCRCTPCKDAKAAYKRGRRAAGAGRERA